jgi:glycosyltransferase involved in cell wall biosynthesis
MTPNDAETQVAGVCVVVPTRNEAANVRPLVHRLGAVLHQHDAQVLFVDDSDDGTPEVVCAVAAQAPVQVRLLHRPPPRRRGGLGGAVTDGLRATDVPWVVVMDGDLQHPPELIPRLLSAATRDDLDVVVASRYRDGGNATGLASPARRAVSAGANTLTRLMFPRRLATVSDPMSGFFAVRRSRLDPAALQPRGFKILLEILARGSADRVGEVPFTFGVRGDGESKASGEQGLHFLHQLLALRLSTLRWGRRRRG